MKPIKRTIPEKKVGYMVPEEDPLDILRRDKKVRFSPPEKPRGNRDKP